MAELLCRLKCIKAFPISRFICTVTVEKDVLAATPWAETRHKSPLSAMVKTIPGGAILSIWYLWYRPQMRQMNVVGKPYEGKLHVRFEVAGAGDGSVDTAPALGPTFILIQDAADRDVLPFSVSRIKVCLPVLVVSIVPSISDCCKARSFNFCPCRTDKLSRLYLAAIPLSGYS